MEGTLPDELYTGLGLLNHLDAGGCNLSGTISTLVGLLTNLIALGLANNNFRGTIPKEVEALTTLQTVLVNGNQLSGSVPVSICQNFMDWHPRVLSPQLVADCLPNTQTGIPAVLCDNDCCTSCCDETGVCLDN